MWLQVYSETSRGYSNRSKYGVKMEITVDGHKVRYQISGEGDKTIVILQGWGTTYEAYDPIMRLLSPHMRVVQFDMPGFGRSPEPEKAWSVLDYTEFFIKFVEALGLKKVILMGHSYGGRVIIRLASRKPSEIPFEIERLVMVDAAGILPRRSPAQLRKIARYKRLKAFLSFPPVYALFKEPIEQWKSRQGSDDYRNATPLMRQALVMAVNEDLSDLLPDIPYETLLVWGDQDTATPLSDGEKMDSLIPDSGLAVIHGAGHFSYLDQPTVFANIMKAYFKI